MIKIALIFFLLKCFPVLAFNYNKCFSKGGSGIITLPISLSQFVSSTGDCSAVGRLEQKKKLFFAYNLNKLKSDFSKGGGEYAMAYAELHGCGVLAQKSYGRIMQDLYQSVNALSEKDTDKSYEALEKLIKENKLLKNECKGKVGV